MAYKVLTYFEDLLDDGHPYQPGDEFPRAGMRVSEKRLAELSGDDNKRGKALIGIEVEEKAEVKAEPKAEKPKAEPKKRSRKTK